MSQEKRTAMNRTIVISRNTAWSLYNFHSGLIRAMIDEGYDVVAVAPRDAYAERLQSCGCSFIALPMDNHGTNPARDMLLLLRYIGCCAASGRAFTSAIPSSPMSTDPWPRMRLAFRWLTTYPAWASPSSITPC